MSNRFYLSRCSVYNLQICYQLKLSVQILPNSTMSSSRRQSVTSTVPSFRKSSSSLPSKASYRKHPSPPSALYAIYEIPPLKAQLKSCLPLEKKKSSSNPNLPTLSPYLLFQLLMLSYHVPSLDYSPRGKCCLPVPMGRLSWWLRLPPTFSISVEATTRLNQKEA